VVGDGAFLGSGTTVVAPNVIGAGATTGANSVVTREAGIGEDEVWAGVPARRLAGKDSVAQRKAAAKQGGGGR
jgi:bifunctional UDP-N-acetylglucosamine pyrophosphorylase/glucosamine-1-phosphate N-acetyltransferase